MVWYGVYGISASSISIDWQFRLLWERMFCQVMDVLRCRFMYEHSNIRTLFTCLLAGSVDTIRTYARTLMHAWYIHTYYVSASNLFDAMGLSSSKLQIAICNAMRVWARAGLREFAIKTIDWALAY